MSHDVSIFGLSRAGFRVPDVVSTPGFVKLVNGTTAKVDVDVEKVQNLLYSEKDNFIRTVPEQTFTVTIASPGVFTANGHGLVNGDIVKLTTTGALPTGLTAGTKYYVVSASTNTFELAATYGGSAIDTSGSQSGTHTLQQVSANIVGLSRFGFRVKDTAGSYVKCKIGTVVQVDLTDYKTLRNLRRNKEMYFVSTSATSVTVRGLTSEQRGFDLVGTASGTITTNGTNVSDGDTVTIGTSIWVAPKNDPSDEWPGFGADDALDTEITSVTYTFKTALTPLAGEVLIGASADASMANLVAAINGAAGAGTTYATGTQAIEVSTAAYSTPTITLTATGEGAGGDYPITKSAVTLTVTGETGGVFKVYQGNSATIDPSDPTNYRQLRRHFKSWIEA